MRHFFLFLAAGWLMASPRTIPSPDGALAVTLSDRDGDLYYRATYKGRGFVIDSRLGLEGIQPEWKRAREKRRKVRSSWKPIFGDREQIPERYNETTLSTKQLIVVFRVFNEGVAFRYRVPAGVVESTGRETTQFNFPNGTVAWEEYGTEGEYVQVPLQDIEDKCERPLTLQLLSGFHAAILEAAQTNWPRMLLTPADTGSLQVAREGAISLKDGAESPWRILLVGERPGDLLERSHVVLSLNPPANMKDTSWIRPGKVIREVTLSTAGGKRAVDFCVKHGLQFIEYDAGWYGHEYDDASDATQVSPDPDRIKSIPNHGGLDLPEVIRYAKSRGVGVILYVNRRALERQMDVLFPLYEKWGVAGVKFGFVNVEGQKWAQWLHDAIGKAAQHHLMVNVHDSYRPSGMTRTFPNLMTQEGVRGNEHMPTAGHNATLPFTRALAGPYDYTICWMTPRLKTTKAHQMAQSVVHYSPWQFLFWYDRPEQVDDEPALEFFKELPTVWDETRVLEGSIGQSAVIARRKGDRWFIGAITNERARTLQVPLDFIHSPMSLTRYCDGSGPRDVDIDKRVVERTDRLSLPMQNSGGCAVILRPAGGPEARLSAHARK